MEKNYWIFNVKDAKNDKYTKTGLQIYDHRMPENFWGIRECTADGKITGNITYLKEGDIVVFYLVGMNGHCFLGTCVLASGFRRLGREEAKKIIHEEYLDWEQGVSLKRVDKWDKPLPIKCLRGKVSFVPIDGKYGLYLQGSVKKISKPDYDTIVREHELIH